jgi:DNA-binding MarR family transcriptional regulator
VNDRAALLARAEAARRRFLWSLHQSTLEDWLNTDLTMPQWKVLMALHAGDSRTVGELAQTLGVRLPTVSGIVDRLEAQGLVGRQSDERDRRVVRIRLTEAGSDLAGRLARVGQQRFRDWLALLCDEDLETVARAFELLAHAAERAPCPAARACRPSNAQV